MIQVDRIADDARFELRLNEAHAYSDSHHHAVHQSAQYHIVVRGKACEEKGWASFSALDSLCGVLTRTNFRIVHVTR